MELENKVAIITGGARGIGYAIAQKLADEGANIAICDVNEQTLSEAEKELSKTGRKVLALKVDVTNSKSVQEFIDQVIEKLGKIDILVNNAGITKDTLIMRMDEAQWDSVINVNLKGVFNCTKAVIKPMMKQRYGKIINIASIIGQIGNPGQVNYAASKGGVIALTKTVAKEVASRNINVNALAPGFIQTAMTDVLSEDVKNSMLKLIPLGKLGTADNIADAVVFFASEKSSYITGQVLRVCGGMVT
ncbi:MAG: 3-oxoacyl-[acyl-carrier-protein] reductase [Candidatus Omnitrophica bacterium]|nr:3-oxoacyl-[acyl-carrier-protein] reductase [Candidatus Omnitrophota bacterium]